jgi:nicotinamide-nucleotide amidase
MRADLLTLSQQLGELLKANNLKLALAESCTGGLAAEYITAVAGSSAWFDCGFVTYSNASKIKMLGVSTTSLDNYGAVSEAVANEMAAGALTHSQADISASITGIAGPDGGSEEKPVGTVCFAWAQKQDGQITAVTATTLFQGHRQAIRHQAVSYLMANLIKKLA